MYLKNIEPISDEKDIIFSPTVEEITLAEESYQKLSAYVQSEKAPAIQLVMKGENSEAISLPASALQLLMAALSQMAHGNAVTITSVRAELTTQEAADLLHVSRSFLVNCLLENGKIPFQEAGARKIVLVKDILRYKQDIDKRRLDVIEDLANEAQKHDMGY